MPLIDPVTMSAPPAAAAPATSPSPVLLHPVPTRPGQPALAVRFTHPVIIAALFLATFRSLVADPPATMRFTLPVLSAVQFCYAVACLPPTGTSAVRLARKARPGAKKTDIGGPSVVVTAILALVLSYLVAPALHILLVLFGAPFLDFVPHTSLLAAHTSVLALFPVLYSRGVDARAWRAVAAFAAPVDEVFGGLVGAAAGAWLGAVPIPLDWDRDWQRWPVTVLAGLAAGYVLGKGIGGTVGYGRTFGVLIEESAEADAKEGKKE